MEFETVSTTNMFPPIEPDVPQRPPRENPYAPPRIIVVPTPPPRRHVLRRWLPLVFWMAVIFAASTSLGRPQNSEAIIDPILRWLGVVQVDQVHIVIRKMGHVAEYSVFGLLLAYFCLSSSWAGLRRRWFVVALVAAFLYACSDEFHQIFVPDRHASFDDVLLDTASVAVVLTLVAALRRLIIRRTMWTAS